jgi:hypothetical protein
MPDLLPMDEVSETQPKEYMLRRFIPKHWIVLGLLVFIHAVLGTCFSIVFLAYKQSFDSFMFAVANSALGFLFSQPILIAIWAAFASQRFYLRFLWSLFLCTLNLYSVALAIFVTAPSDLFFIAIVDLMLFIAATPIMLLVRRFARWQITYSCREDVSSEYQVNQFGIKHLIILTSITALACGLFRSLIMISPKFIDPPIAYVARITCEVVLMFLPIIIIPWFTLAYLKNMLSSIVYAIILLGIIEVANYYILNKIKYIPDIIQVMLFLQLGASISVFFTTLAIRLCGFRLVRVVKA